jgi:hypothetical protein
MSLTRRALLWGSFGVAASIPVAAHSAARAGQTLQFALADAPFPHGSGAYADNSVWVYVPPSFVVPPSGTIDAVVHFHGHNTTAKKALASHKLREQMDAAKQNAILVVPQGPIDAADGNFGRLMERGGLRRLLHGVRESLVRTDRTRFRIAKNVGRVILSAHSGGYRAAAAGVARGGVGVREVFLFDALYGESGTFARFMTDDPKRHKLVSYYVGGAPKTLSLALAGTLEAAGVSVRREHAGEHLSRGDLTRGRAVFLEGRGIHATATWEENALRDCLFASCLRGNHDGAWFADKKRPRAS